MTPQWRDPGLHPGLPPGLPSETIPFEQGKAGCTAVALIVVILVVAGIWALSNWIGGGPSPSPSPTPLDTGGTPPPSPIAHYAGGSFAQMAACGWTLHIAFV